MSHLSLNICWISSSDPEFTFLAMTWGTPNEGSCFERFILSQVQILNSLLSEWSVALPMRHHVWKFAVSQVQFLDFILLQWKVALPMRHWFKLSDPEFFLSQWTVLSNEIACVSSTSQSSLRKSHIQCWKKRSSYVAFGLFDFCYSLFSVRLDKKW